MDERVNRACRELSGFVCGEVDIGDSPTVLVEDKLDCSVRRKCQVPNNGFLVRSRDHPMSMGSVRGPLNVGNRPRGEMLKESRGIIRIIKVNDMKSVSSGRDFSATTQVRGIQCKLTMPKQRPGCLAI
jgi:hypothetical protein